MTPALAADLLVLLHAAFILFVALGGLLVLRWPRLAWLHVPAALWGALIELHGSIVCPLTPWENALRQAAGEAGYAGGFVDHYVVPLVYPLGLTRDMQVWLGVLVLVVNGLAYGALIVGRRRARQR
ncbi:MAG: DUF2784 domain-containing protein [Chromatiaceae bacterium]